MPQALQLVVGALLAICIAEFATAERDSVCAPARPQRQTAAPSHEQRSVAAESLPTDGDRCDRHRSARGNSLLQVASRPSKIRFAGTSASETPEDLTKMPANATSPINASSMKTGLSNRSAINPSLVASATPASNSSTSASSPLSKNVAMGTAHGLARTTASFMQAILHVQHSLGGASTSGAFYVLLLFTVVFCILCLLGYLYLQAAGRIQETDMRLNFPPSRAHMSKAGRTPMGTQKNPQASPQPVVRVQSPMHTDASRESAMSSRTDLQRPHVRLHTQSHQSLMPSPEPTAMSLMPTPDATDTMPLATWWNSPSSRKSPPNSKSHLGPGSAQALLPSMQPTPQPPRVVPPSPVSSPRADGDIGMATKQLCPGLVVPRNSECVLALCALPRNNGSANENVRLEILDLAGQPVLRAQVQLPWPADRTPVIRLASLRHVQPSHPKEEHLVLARAGGSAGMRRSTYLYDSNDVLFGFIKRDMTRPRYVLTSSRGGVNLLFEGTFEQYKVKVLSERREMLATTEPCAMPFDPGSKYYQVRIAENVDVGLIMSGLLAIDAMET